MTKAVILAGGFGTRFSEETTHRPKPLIEIGGRPILWHIMKYYAAFGVREFVICAGYKQEMIKEYFANYALHAGTVTFDMKAKTMSSDGAGGEDWTVTVADTGENTLTGGRVKRIKPYVGKDPFFLTYGDGLSDIDLRALTAHHKKTGAQVTLSAVHPPARFGELDIAGGMIRQFMEKDAAAERRINGGFMLANPDFLDTIAGDDTWLEREPLQEAARQGKLAAYEHNGFWQCMDKLYDKNLLEGLWAKGQAPWKAW